jgi:N6-adenosine-specific RNA methylase IME4
MTPLPPGPFKIIYADPPWNFQTRSAKGLDGRPQHYDRMSLKDIKEMPVSDVADADCWLFLWTTGPHLAQAFAVIEAWGFKYSGMGFVWIKLNKNAMSLFFTLRDVFMGGGYTTRKNAEFCLLARRGKPKRIGKNVREVLISPVREHSRKPDEFYDRIEAYAEGPYLELFSRCSAPNWTAWGNQTEKFKKVVDKENTTA